MAVVRLLSVFQTLDRMPQGAFKKKKGSVATRSKGIRKPTQILRKGGEIINFRCVIITIQQL